MKTQCINIICVSMPRYITDNTLITEYDSENECISFYFCKIPIWRRGKMTSNKTHFQKGDYERVGCETTNVQVNKLTNSNGK